MRGHRPPIWLVSKVNRSENGVTMTNIHRRLDADMAQRILQDDPVFLHEIEEGVLQEMLESEMTEHRGNAPTRVRPSVVATATATSREH
jgi:hypothetical protein